MAEKPNNSSPLTKEELKDKVLSLYNDYGYSPLLFEEMKDVLTNQGVLYEEDMLVDVVRELIDDYILYPSKKKRIGLLSQFRMYKGIIHIKKQGFGFLTSPSLDEDAFIPKEECRDALDGDTVLAVVNQEAEYGKRKEGSVVKVIERSSNMIVGTVMKSYHGGYRIEAGTNVEIIISDFKESVPGDIVKIKIKNANGYDYILGEIIEIIGNVNTPGMDELAIAYNYGFNEKFSLETTQEVEALVKEYEEIKQKEIDRRNKIKSYQDRRIITIDGEDAKDLDDAISIKKLDNGNYRLGVYIADVSFFVRENTSLDNDAYIRGTSVYLTDHVLPMLPFKLCNDLCSLNEGEQKLALCLEMEIDENATLIDYELTEGVIESTHRMTYTVVNKILSNQIEDVDKKYEDVFSDLALMDQLAKIIRNQKEERGSLNFDIPEAKIIVDENGKPIDVIKRERGEGEQLIEDFMVFANETIASIVYHLELPFIYRVHDEPDSLKMKNFNQILKNTSFKMNSKVKTVSPNMLQRLLNEVNKVDLGISQMLLRLMAKAEYSTLNIGHFGLASKCYTHYTSPIRRYPDLIVHRLVKKYIIHSDTFYSEESNNEQGMKQLEEKLMEQAKMCSSQERKADDCEYDCGDLKMAEYMEDHIGETFDGTIISVTNFGFFVRLPNLIEGLVSVRDLTDDYYVYDSENMRLEGTSKHKTYKLGSSVKVKCINASKETKQIDFIVSCGKMNANKKPTSSKKNLRSKDEKKRQGLTKPYSSKKSSKGAKKHAY